MSRKMFYALIRPLLFLLPAETAHRLAFRFLRLLQAINPLRSLVSRWWKVRDPALKVDAFGRQLSTPVGLAAGLDKDAEAYEALGALGFGFIEIGTVTAQPQPGNERPRLFRLPKDRALINRMGFNNSGAAAAAKRLNRRRNTVVGVNIGKSKVTPEEEAPDDYRQSTGELARHADYFVVNVSSPNTPGLRNLQAVSSLRPLLIAVKTELERASPERRVPLFVKIAPDLADADVDAVADLALELELDGIVATNTTLSREGLRSDAEKIESIGAGGLSGPPLKARALEVISRLRRRLGEKPLLIASGGIENADDAWERICAGANLIQVYTGFIYQGPSIVRSISKGLAKRSAQAGFSTISEAVGSALGSEARKPSHPEESRTGSDLSSGSE